MRRDIITVEDVAALNEAAALERAARLPDDATTAPDRLRDLGGARRTGVASGAAAEIPAPDSWNERLLKYIPGEAVGLYLALDRAVHTVGALQAPAERTKLAICLAVALAASVLFNVLYLRLVWRVRRNIQIAASTVALVAYAYATGGAFEPIGLADPSVQMIVVIVVAAFLVLFKPPGQAASTAPPTSSRRAARK
jgi:hypothetical protein